MELLKSEIYVMKPGQQYTVTSPADGVKLTEEELSRIIGSNDTKGIIYISAKASYIDSADETFLIWDDTSRQGRNVIANQIREENIGDCVDSVYGNAILCHIDLLPDSLVIEA